MHFKKLWLKTSQTKQGNRYLGIGSTAVTLVVSDSLAPLSARLLCPWNSLGKNTGVGHHVLLQGIFLTQGSNLHFLHCRQILYPLSHFSKYVFSERVCFVVLSAIILSYCIGVPLVWFKYMRERDHPTVFGLNFHFHVGLCFGYVITNTFSSVQSLSRVLLFVTPWIAVRQASLSSPSPGVHADSCPLSQWCHPAISSSVVPFSYCPQSLPASESL